MNYDAVSAIRPDSAQGCLSVELGSTVEAELALRARDAGLSASELARCVLIDWLSHTAPSRPKRLGPVEVDPLGRKVVISGELIHLSPLEARILAALAWRPGQTVSVEEMIRLTWGPGVCADRRVLAVHVCRLREKLAPGIQIKGARRKGYCLELAHPPPLEDELDVERE